MIGTESNTGETCPQLAYKLWTSLTEIGSGYSYIFSLQAIAYPDAKEDNQQDQRCPHQQKIACCVCLAVDREERAMSGRDVAENRIAVDFVAMQARGRIERNHRPANWKDHAGELQKPVCEWKNRTSKNNLG